MSRQNTTFWPKVGETVVGKMGLGEQVSIKCIVPPAVTMNTKYYWLVALPIGACGYDCFDSCSRQQLP